MAQANPDDDSPTSHTAKLFDSDRFAEAINVLRHVVRLNDGTRAYVLLGQSQLEQDHDSAIETFQQGHAAAMNRGDLMPATEMKQKLTELGASVSAAVLALLNETGPEDEREPEEGEGAVRERDALESR